MSALIAIFSTLVVLLIIPVDLEFSMLRREGRSEGKASLIWLFGLTRVNLRPRPEFPRSGSGRFRILDMLEMRGFVWSMKRFVRDLFRAVRILDLRLEARIGLDDPAETGRLWAMLAPWVLWVPDIRIEPEFSAQAFDFEARGRIRISVIRVLKAIFALAPFMLRAMRKWKK